MNSHTQPRIALEAFLNNDSRHNLKDINDLIDNNVRSVDDKGNTLLHITASYKAPDIMNILLQRISHEKNALEIINRINYRGNTALHKAFRVGSIAVISSLIDAHADLTTLNEERKIRSYQPAKKPVTPLMLLQQLPTAKQFKIIQRLNESQKNIVLNLYRDELINKYASAHDNHFQELRKLYFLCRGQQSLQALLLAHHEFNETILPLDIITKKTQRNGEPFYGFKTKINGIQCIYNIDDLLKRMPFFAKNQPELFKKLNHELKNNNKTAKQHYQYLNEDRNFINGLINDIDNYKAQLIPQNIMRKGPDPKFWATLVACICVYLAIETWLGYEAATRSTDERLEMKTNNATLCDEKKQSSYNPDTEICTYKEANENYFVAGSALFGVLAPIIVASIGWVVFPSTTRYYYHDVSRREWQPILTKLENLMVTLNSLKQKTSLSQQQQTTLNELKESIEGLKVRTIRNAGLQDILDSIKSNLKNIRQQMISSNSSITFFARQNLETIEPSKDAVIDIEKLKKAGP